MNALTPTARAAALFDLASVRMEDVPPLRRAVDLLSEAVAIIDAERAAADAVAAACDIKLDAFPEHADSIDRWCIEHDRRRADERAGYLYQDGRALDRMIKDLEEML